MRSPSRSPVAPFNLSHSGRNEHGQLGSGNTNDIDDPAALSSSLYTKAPVALRSAKIVHVACGRSHTLLVTDAGQLYVSGSNFLGMCGDPSTQGKDILSWKLIAGAWGEDKVVKAAAGVLFSIVLTASGRIYAFGTGEKGVLGNGKVRLRSGPLLMSLLTTAQTGEHIVRSFLTHCTALSRSRTGWWQDAVF